MFIHPDGSVTGSVNHAVLDAYNDAKARGADLSEFAPFLAENSSEAQLAQGASVSRTEPSVEAKAADERAAAAAKAVQESSDQRSADLAAQSSQSQPGGQQAAPEDDGDYEDWSLAELQGEAESRGLPKSGTKAELADRLRQAD